MRHAYIHAASKWQSQGKILTPQPKHFQARRSQTGQEAGPGPMSAGTDSERAQASHIGSSLYLMELPGQGPADFTQKSLRGETPVLTTFSVTLRTGQELRGQSPQRILR